MAPSKGGGLGGYSEETVRKLKSARIPDKIKCATCNKYRRLDAFSNAQLNRLRNAVALKGHEYVESGKANIRCRSCVGSSTVELTCVVCGKTKAIDEFAKNQRHNPDRARCQNCVQDHLEGEPWGNSFGIEEADSTAQYETNVMSRYDDETMTRSGGEASFDENSDTVSRGTARTVSAHGFRDEDDDDDDSVGGGVWVDSSRGDESEIGKTRSHIFTAFDAQGIGHLRVASEGGESGSVPTGWKSGTIDKEDPSPREQRTVRKKKSGRWAKITGPRFPKGTAPTMRIPESGRCLDVEDEKEEGKVRHISDYL